MRSRLGAGSGLGSVVRVRVQGESLPTALLAHSDMRLLCGLRTDDPRVHAQGARVPRGGVHATWGEAAKPPRRGEAHARLPGLCAHRSISEATEVSALSSM